MIMSIDNALISQYWEHTQVYDHPNKKSRKPVEHKGDFDTYNNFKYSNENETRKVCRVTVVSVILTYFTE